MNATPFFKGRAAIVPRPEPLWLVEPEEQHAMMMPAAELTMLERHMAEPERDIPVAELEHQTALAEVPEVSRLDPWDMSELGRETMVDEVPEVPRLGRTMHSKDATVVELEAMVSQVQLRPSVPRQMARTEASVTCSAGSDTIANAATTAASTTILHIASLPDRASGAARDVPHRARRKSELRGPLFDFI